jgi:hypothetical protein
MALLKNQIRFKLSCPTKFKQILQENPYLPPENMINTNRSDRGKNLHILRKTRAVSTILFILLLLCAAIIGALVSYVWVIASYYNVPNSTTLSIESAVFPVTNFSYFNLTILNPSYSLSDVNVTGFRVTVIDTNTTFDVNMIEYPGSLPYVLQKGVLQTFRCIRNWSNITGENVTIRSLPTDILTAGNMFTVPPIKLNLTPVFDASQTVGYFNLKVQNPPESTNLTISEIAVAGEQLSVTPSLPYVLQNNGSITFICNQNWEDLRYQNATLTVQTAEGYATSYTTNTLPGATLQISDVKFDYSDTSYFNLTIDSTASSTTSPILSSVNLTWANQTSSLFTIPQLNFTTVYVSPNQSLTLRCLWNWNAIRSENITIKVYTNQTFTVPAETLTTPPPTVWNITDVKFDLDDLTRFSVNVTNLPCSVNNVTITKIQLNSNDTILSPASAVLTSGNQTTFGCAINWTSFIGQSTTLTVFTADGTNMSTVVTVPSTQLKITGSIPVYGDLNDTTLNITSPYLNVTISNSVNSVQNVTINKLVLQAGNITQDLVPDIVYPKVTSRIYEINTNQTITFVCFSDYTKYIQPSIATITITVYTSQGIFSTTWHR